MKNICLLFFFSLCSLSTLHSEDFSLKYGTVTNDELNMKIYAKDSAAAAVVLYDNGYSCYEYNSGFGFCLLSNYKKKIKILKQEGIGQATISIPYYFATTSNSERVEGLEAIAYNLENGKIVKTKLDKKYIFNEEINNKYRQIKFSIPNVKVGTVIEYKYKMFSPFAYSLPDCEMQTDVPVINSTYEVIIPEYFFFNLAMKGFEHIDVAESQGNQQFNLGSSSNGANTISCTSRNLKFSAKDIPALKDENYVWCVNDFNAGVRFELSGTKFPNDFYKTYARTWEDLENTLNKETDFATNISTSNPYKDEIKALVSNITDERQKTELIYGFIKSRIRWDKTYSFYGNKAKESVKNGTGDNAQINIILMSALKDAGIKTYPVLISRRSKGRLPFSYPSLNKLNTFIVAAETSNGAVMYMDGSAVNGGLNILPTNLLVDRGYIFGSSRSEKWVDLTNLEKNTRRSYLSATLDNDGNLKGTIDIIYTNQEAYSIKSSVSEAKDSMEIIDKIQNESQIIVDSLSITGKEPMSNRVAERLVFTKKIDNNGEFLYINPMIFLHLSKNDFTQTERKLPIEFAYPLKFTSVCSINIPDNYQIEELPKSLLISLEGDKGKCLYRIDSQENNIRLNYSFGMDQIIFPSTDYPAIRDFYGQVATKNMEMIVLKKKQL